MIRLGLQLTLHSGREAFVRLLVTAAAVAVGVALLLGVLAEFHAFQANASQPCWSCTQGAAVPRTLPSHGDLWNNSVDFYRGQTISRLDVAALGALTPMAMAMGQTALSVVLFDRMEEIGASLADPDPISRAWLDNWRSARAQVVEPQ